MSLIKSNPISSRMFDWNGERKTFCQEMSSLKGFDPFQRIYDDACDVGFRIESATTNKIVTFYHVSTDKDPEGEIGGWWFEAIDEDIRRYPRLRGVKCLIIND